MCFHNVLELTLIGAYILFTFQFVFLLANLNNNKIVPPHQMSMVLRYYDTKYDI